MQKDEKIQLSHVAIEDLQNEINRRKERDEKNRQQIPERMEEINKMYSTGHITRVSRVQARLGHKLMFIVSTDIVER